jgi:low molecular weight phosphotyrosine protein phosphatase
MSDPTPQNKKVSVLFVCLGNICRSPMAEGVFRSLTSFNTTSAHPLISRIDSCGTGAYHAGDNPDPRTISVLKSHGITDYKHAARKVRVPQDFEEFDYVLAMDGMNMRDLRDMTKRKGKGEGKAKLALFGDFGGERGEEVQDPYYGGGKGFEVAFEQVERFGMGLLEVIEKEAGEKSA